MIVNESNNIHLQKFGKELQLNKDEMYVFMGILILSSYVKVPNHRLFWSTNSDTRNLDVSECGMSRNRYEQIMSSFHFVDNTAIDTTDRLFKV